MKRPPIKALELLLAAGLIASMIAGGWYMGKVYGVFDGGVVQNAAAGSHREVLAEAPNSSAQNNPDTDENTSDNSQSNANLAKELKNKLLAIDKIIDQQGRSIADTQDKLERNNAQLANAEETISHFLFWSSIILFVLGISILSQIWLAGRVLGRRPPSAPNDNPVPTNVADRLLAIESSVEQLKEQIASLRDQSGGAGPAPTPPVVPLPRVAPRREAPRNDGPTALRALGAQSPSPAFSGSYEGRLAELTNAFNGVAAMLPPSPSAFRDALGGVSALRDVAFGPDGSLDIMSDYGGSTAFNLTAVCIDPDHFALFPSFDYLKEFGLAFSPELSAGQAIKSCFDLRLDGSGKLKCLRAGLLTREGGRLSLTRRGTLDGYIGAG